ncbi:hypothetical protein A0H81_08954 [Grifola frondosa]|uniref:Uncharacterized protein n=1 Tax=Grifola frondosa TaxID=5627 RepID=A0A1C7M940_GRIFR|nr:hypothetical protein A0H81_08954 [Grifola frondosa]
MSAYSSPNSNRLCLRPFLHGPEPHLILHTRGSFSEPSPAISSQASYVISRRLKAPLYVSPSGRLKLTLFNSTHLKHDVSV